MLSKLVNQKRVSINLIRARVNEFVKVKRKKGASPWKATSKHIEQTAFHKTRMQKKGLAFLHEQNKKEMGTTK